MQFVDALVETMQLLSDVLPDGDVVSEGQGVQDVAPENDEKVPAAHGLQVPLCRKSRPLAL